MSLTAESIDADWEFFEPKTLVSYVPYDNATDANIGGETVTGIEALIEEPTKEDYQYGESTGVHQQLKVWNLRVSMMGGVKVTKNGKIVDGDGVEWVVIRSIKRTIGTRWKCLSYALEG